MTTLYVGDTHGHFNCLRAAINHYKPDRVFQVGDLGYWPTMPSWQELGGFSVPVRFCDGNHEDHGQLPEVVTELKPNLFFQPRYTTHENHLFIGGASSIDRHLRTPGLDWFPEETLKACPLVLPQANVVVSHTCPNVFMEAFNLTERWGLEMEKDISRAVLDNVLKRLTPKLWVFGHFHQIFDTVFRGIRVVCLDQIHPKGKHGFNPGGALFLP